MNQAARVYLHDLSFPFSIDMEQKVADPRTRSDADRVVSLWLFVMATLVGVMVVIGGITRLTGSGLSMAEWRPVIGWLPPLSEDQWRHVFELYKTTPEYRHANSWMEIKDFRSIFWWEYAHRLAGRLIGLVFLLPFLWFLCRGMLRRRRLVPRLLLLFALGSLQGLVGWWMVKSGLIDNPGVSQYRLTLHLSLAFVILGLLIWTGLDIVGSGSAGMVASPLRRHAACTLAALCVTIVAGALVAGLDAGQVHNTFPLMGGRIVPPDYGSHLPFWLNAFENPVAAQFHHRLFAILTLTVTLALLWRVMRSRLAAALRLPAHALAAIVLVQSLLGITTLLLAVPTTLAALHQAGAVAGFAVAVWLFHAWRGSVRAA